MFEKPTDKGGRRQGVAAPHVLYQCPAGHMVTPAALVIMEIHEIGCPLCLEGEGNAADFEVVPVEDLPRTSDEYGEKVMEADEVILYGRDEPAPTEGERS